MKAFITSHISHFPSTRTFPRENTEHHIYKKRKRTLKPDQNETSNLTLDELLLKDKSMIIHRRNPQLL